MNLFSLYSSPLWLIPSVLLSLFLSYFLYRKSNFKSKVIKRLLLTLRFILLFSLCFLLLNPVLNHIQRTTILPKIVFAIDNSESMKSMDKEDLFLQINQLKASLEKQGNEVFLKTIDNKDIVLLDSVVFDLPMTDLDAGLTAIQKEFEEDNLQSIVLFSDGLQNKGVNPLYKNYYFPIHTVSLGDTTSTKDIILQKVVSNKKVLPNSEIPLDVFVDFEGYAGHTLSLEVLSNDNCLLYTSPSPRDA